jgi:tryptophan 2,3-dioxygenase
MAPIDPRLTYGSYLKVPQLLNLQQQLSDPPHHDEMFFIIIHQSFELWFKECLHETDLLVESLRLDSVSRALKVLKRINAIFDLLVQKIRLLSTLTPAEFAGFRDRLRPASGFQSVQFRELELACGLRDRFFFRYFKEDPQAIERLQRRFESPSIYDEFLRSLDRAGYPIDGDVLERDVTEPHQLNENLVERLTKVYTRPSEDYHWVLMCEALVDLDSLFGLWRSTHLWMVARTIGDLSGTGGSAGVKFLESRVGMRFFPELWAVRTRIGGGTY